MAPPKISAGYNPPEQGPKNSLSFSGLTQDAAKIVLKVSCDGRRLAPHELCSHQPKYLALYRVSASDGSPKLGFDLCFNI
jgi:hypothetical protein